MLDPKIYPRAKFISEFGFQSWPSWPAYKKVTRPGDWSQYSHMSAFRCAICFMIVLRTYLRLWL